MRRGGRDAERLAGDDERHGGKNQRYTRENARREPFAEDQHAEKERRDGFQRPENRRGRGTNAADGAGHRDERDDRGKQRQRDGIDPKQRRRDHLQTGDAPQTDQIDAQAEEQRIESQLLGRKVAQRGAIDPHDINGVAERREEDQRNARKAQRGSVAALVEQRDAAQSQQNRKHGGGGDPLAEAGRHDDGHHHGVEEQDRRGDARVHVVVAGEQAQRREGKKQSHDRQRQDVAPCEREGLPPEDHQRTEHDDSQQIAVKKDRIRTQPRPVEGQSEERI